MTTFQIYFSPMKSDNGYCLAYSAAHMFGAVGFSDRGPRTVEFASIEVMKEALHKVGLPTAIAENGFTTQPLFVTSEQMTALGYKFPLED